MNPASIFTGYLAWHYGRAFQQMVVVYANLFWFIGHFFSLNILFRTLFSPWRRIYESHHRGEGAEAYFATVVVNILTRIIGAFIRLIFIVAGLVVMFVMVLSVIAFTIFWLFAPFIVTLAFITGISLLF